MIKEQEYVKKKKKKERIDEPHSKINNINELCLENIYYIYKDEKIDVVALKNLTMTFKKGEIYVLMGPSGSGKTTLLNIIGGILKPSSGKYNINNEKNMDISEKQLNSFRHKKIGYVFQNNNLFNFLTIEENLEFTLIGYDFPKDKRNKLIDELLQQFDLTDRRDHTPNELSGGQKQKAGITIALSFNPDILLADEPTGDLDSVSRDLVLKIFKDIHVLYPNKIIIIVTHDPEFLKIATIAYFLEDGSIKSKFTQDDLEVYDNKLKIENVSSSNIQLIAKKFELEKIKANMSEINKSINKVDIFLKNLSKMQ